MNYQKIYDNFISTRTHQPEGQYIEVHHIVPRSLGGSDNNSNLIRLTGREHYFAHLLLAKIHGGSMWQAIFLMGKRCGINSHKYEHLKVKAAKAHSLRMKGRIAHNKGSTTPANVREKQRQAKLGKRLTDSHRDKLRNALAKRERDAEWAANISKGLQGHSVPDSVRAKISDTLKGNIPCNKGVKQPLVECPHCGKTGGETVMMRWHFNNCKFVK